MLHKLPNGTRMCKIEFGKASYQVCKVVISELGKSEQSFFFFRRIGPQFELRKAKIGTSWQIQPYGSLYRLSMSQVATYLNSILKQQRRLTQK